MVPPKPKARRQPPGASKPKSSQNLGKTTANSDQLEKGLEREEMPQHEQDKEVIGEEHEQEGDGEQGSHPADSDNKPKRKFTCPFSHEREGAKYLCKWVPHADKRSVS